MSTSPEDGIIAVILRRYTHQRLPWLLDLKAQVSQGKRLDERDLQFLQTIHDTQRGLLDFVNRRSDCQVIFAKANALYVDVMAKAIANEAKISP